MTFVLASTWTLPRFWEGALLLPPHVLCGRHIGKFPIVDEPWVGKGKVAPVSQSPLPCGGPGLPSFLPSLSIRSGLSSPGFAMLRGLGARGDVLGKQSLVVLSPFLLYFRVVPCKEYLKESKALQN